jgi:hypothetical protein
VLSISLRMAVSDFVNSSRLKFADSFMLIFLNT